MTATVRVHSALSTKPDTEARHKDLIASFDREITSSTGKRGSFLDTADLAKERQIHTFKSTSTQQGHRPTHSTHVSHQSRHASIDASRRRQRAASSLAVADLAGGRTAEPLTATDLCRRNMPTLPETLALGALLNLWLLHQSAGSEAPLPALLPARIFFTVSAFRCTFPCRYKGNVVLRDTWLSSILLTRTLATVAEVSWIYQLAWLGFALNPASVLMFCLAVGMMACVVLAQGCVWIAVLSNTHGLMYWEELGWAAIFMLNTLINAVVVSPPPGSLDGPRRVSWCFGCVYLPYQLLLHIPKLYADRFVECTSTGTARASCPVVSWQSARRAACFRAPTTDWQRWGGFVGAIWMVCYWGLLPLWHIYLVSVVPPNLPS